MEETKQEEKKKTVLGKVLRIVFRTVLILILVVALIALSILTPPVQNFLRKKATVWLSNKLNTRVDIGRIYIGFPKKVVIEGIYIEDRAKDTLLAGDELKVDISMLKLLHSEVEVSQVDLSGITAKVNRLLPDTTYNFQFIIDAFASGKPSTPSTDTSSMKISVKGIDLDKIRLVYKDDVTGNDVTFWLDHFDTEFDAFDLDKMKFSVPETNIKGINARIYQHKPLVVAAAEVKPQTDTVSTASAPLDFEFGKLNLSNINLDYGNDVSALFANLKLGDFSVKADKIDLPNKNIVLTSISLENTTAVIRMGKNVNPAAAPVVVTSDSTAQTNSGWRLLVKNLELNNNNIAMSDENKPVLKNGMDFSHLDAKGITFHADDLVYGPDTISASITKGQLAEKSGFILNTFETDFLYAGNQAYLKNLLVETPGTTIRRSIGLKYPSLETLKKDIGKLQLNVEIDNSKIQVKDILTFVPSLASQPAFGNPSATWLLNGNITGSVSNMNIEKLQLRAFGSTALDLHGRVAGLPDSKKLNGNLVINNFHTSSADIKMLAPKGSLPSGITLPETMTLRGTLSGSMNNARAKLDLATSLGGAGVEGTISNATNKKTAQYNATLNARKLQLGVIMQNDSLFGPLTATIMASGTGFDPKTANAKVKATVVSAVLNRYEYKDVRLTAALLNQKANVDLAINDPNISIQLKGKGDIAGKYPVVSLNADINELKTFPLHFTTDTLEYKGNINADFASTNPANLDGKLLITKSLLITPAQQYALDTIALTSGKTDTGQFIRLRSDAISFALTGKYNLTQLGTVFQQSVQPYYALSAEPAKKDTIDDYDFRFVGEVINGPLLKIFAPTLTQLDPVKMQGHFSSDKGWSTNIDAPLIVMGANRIQKFRLNAATGKGAINLRTDIQQYSSGPTMNIYATSIDARIAENKINFLVNLKDIDNKNKYRIGGLFNQPEQGSYALNLNPDSLMLNYDKWVIAPENMVKLDKGDINISHFAISRSGQQLSINSTSQEENSPLEIRFTDFRIGTITAFAKQDSALADGIINGAVVVKNFKQQPVFTSDLNITDLTFRTDTVGNLVLKVNNNEPQKFNADISLTGKGNDVRITGAYLVKPENQSVIDLTMNINALQMASVQAFSMGALTNTKGFINGKFDFSGTFDKPNIDGNLKFNQAGFTPTMLGSYFTLDQQSIVVNNSGIHFNAFTILDSARNELVLDGDALTSNFMNYKLNMDLSATNFQALNSTKQNSKLFYGRFYFDTDLHIGGTEKSPVIDGSLTINENTRFTVVLPQSQPGVQEREGIVRFVDMDSVKLTKPVQLTAMDSLSKSDITGMEISVNIEIKKEAELTLVVDEANGDALRMKGTAQLSGGIDPSGKTTLTGTYEIDEGSYDLSFNLIKRNFKIKQGSKITWLGEPTRANVDLTAVYVANTAPLTLVESQSTNLEESGTYKQKLPFNVNLHLEGELMKPDISFDIVLPDQNYTVSSEVIDNTNARLANLRMDEGELNKQVFALLLLNRFVAENPFASSGGGGFNAGTAARQSVSKILSDQLNNLATDLIKGVDLNFDLASQEDYTTGTAQNRTDLNVSLSKQLLNDRLKVTIGSNFELEGPQSSSSKSQNNLAGNVAVDYLLSKDGRYMIRAYRKNEFEGELEGYIIESGVKFIIRFDYDKLRELFHNPKQKLRPARKARQDEPNDTDSRKASVENRVSIKE